MYHFQKVYIPRKGIAITIIAIIIAGFTAGYFYIQNKFIVEPLSIGEKVAPVVVNTLDGKEVSTKTFLNRRRNVIVFFSTSCSHCEDVIKNVCLFFPVIKDSLNIVAISIDGKEDTEKFIARLDIEFPVYLNKDYQAGKVFHVYHVPAIIFLDEEQKLVKFSAGKQSREQLHAMLLSFTKYL